MVRRPIVGLLVVVVLGGVFLACTGTPAAPSPTTSASPQAAATVRYLAHSSFLITSASGFSVLIDPYTVTASMQYSPITEAAEVVTVSHGHGDHNNVAAVQGSPEVVKEAGSGRSVSW